MTAEDQLRILVGAIRELRQQSAGIDQTLANLQLAIERQRVQLEAIANRPDPEGWLSVKQIAAMFPLSEQWFKEHGDELGGLRDGPGHTAKWMFRVSDVEAGLRKRSNTAPVEPTPAPRPVTSGHKPGVDLLPVRGLHA